MRKILVVLLLFFCISVMADLGKGWNESGLRISGDAKSDFHGKGFSYYCQRR